MAAADQLEYSGLAGPVPKTGIPASGDFQDSRTEGGPLRINPEDAVKVTYLGDPLRGPELPGI